LLFIESSEADRCLTGRQKASKYSFENAPRHHFFGENGKKTKIAKSNKVKRDPEKLFIRDPRKFSYLE